MEWYDGELQCFRLEREYQTDIQFIPRTVDGVRWTWNDYIISTETPETLAKVWQYCYENGGTDTALRQQKARYYYGIIGSQIPVWLLCFMKKKGMILCRRM